MRGQFGVTFLPTIISQTFRPATRERGGATSAQVSCPPDEEYTGCTEIEKKTKW